MDHYVERSWGEEDASAQKEPSSPYRFPHRLSHSHTMTATAMSGTPKMAMSDAASRQAPSMISSPAHSMGEP